MATGRTARAVRTVANKTRDYIYDIISVYFS